jgi:hypothetical protein
VPSDREALSQLVERRRILDIKGVKGCRNYQRRKLRHAAP